MSSKIQRKQPDWGNDVIWRLIFFFFFVIKYDYLLYSAGTEASNSVILRKFAFFF